MEKPQSNPEVGSQRRAAKGRTVAVHQGQTILGAGVPLSTAEFFTDIRRPAIRSTPVEDFDSCPRKFLYRYKLGITPSTYQSPLTMGKIVHSILQSLFLGQSEEEALEVASAVINKEQQRLIGVANPAGFLPDGADLQAQLKKLDEDYHKARAMALVFWQANPFPVDKWDILHSPAGEPMVEQLLTVNIPSLGRCPVVCPCDLALVKRGTFDVWIVDFKTTSFDAKVRAIPTKFSAQLQLYRLALDTILKEWAKTSPAYRPYRVVGSLHAILQKPGIKFCPNTKDKGGFHEYVARLVQWYRDLEEKDPKNPPMILDPNRFSGPPLPVELQLRLRQYCKAAWAAPDINAFYRVGGGACLRYNKACPFTPLCNSDPAVWPTLIRERYAIQFREDEEGEDQDV